MSKEYFANTEYISNSQLRSFVSYGKYGDRLLTPDIYKAFYINKTEHFKVNEAIIVGKIVDRYFDGEGEKVWDSYEVKARRSAEDKLSENIISTTMENTALTMIKWGNNWDKFQEYINHKGTTAQTQLLKELELSDIDGVIHKIKIKGLPDYINEDKKLIVDLKTSGNLQMIVDDLQFKGEPKLTAGYIRQLANYNQLLGGGYDGALALITEKGIKWIDIPNWILEKATVQLEYDLIECNNFIINPTSINESIFIDEPLELN